MTWIWEQRDWPAFRWTPERIVGPLAQLRHRQGRLLGRFAGLGFEPRARGCLDALTQDATMTSAIEGEQLDVEQVRSSVARRLGVDIGALRPADRHVDGLVDMTLDATRNFAAPLTKARLLGWHAALFPDGRSGIRRIRVGKWRDDASGPMQVISGPMGRERVHFRAPPAARVDAEIDALLEWLNAPPDIDPVLLAAQAHLWFLTIHPFEDGNGRIARAIADLALTRSEQDPQRFYSMSAQIRAERSAYYATLEATQRGGLDISEWILWFLACLERAITAAEDRLADVLFKAEFWLRHADAPLNPRQLALLNRLLDGFEGKLTSSKWAKLGKCSQDTAGRDIAALIELGILRKGPAGGRSTSYELVRR